MIAIGIICIYIYLFIHIYIIYFYIIYIYIYTHVFFLRAYVSIYKYSYACIYIWILSPSIESNDKHSVVLAMYGVASVSRIDKIVGLFCKRALQKRQYSAKETYNFIDSTDRSHPIAVCLCTDLSTYLSSTYICMNPYTSVPIYLLSIRMYVNAHKSVYFSVNICSYSIAHEYGVATISRLLKIIGLFCKRAL